MVLVIAWDPFIYTCVLSEWSVGAELPVNQSAHYVVTIPCDVSHVTQRQSKNKLCEQYYTIHHTLFGFISENYSQFIMTTTRKVTSQPIPTIKSAKVWPRMEAWGRAGSSEYGISMAKNLFELNLHTICHYILWSITRKQYDFLMFVRCFSGCLTSKEALLIELWRYVKRTSRARHVLLLDVHVMKQGRGPLSGLVGCVHASRVLVNANGPLT